MKRIVTRNLTSFRVFIALFLLTVVLQSTASALQRGRPISEYIHDVWQNDQGLPQDYVVGIAQTTDGYLWLATQEGLARFDGVRFTVFDNQNIEIGENNIQALCGDDDGGLWFGTEGSGLFLLKEGKLNRYSTKDGLPSDIVEAIAKDHDGNIWVGTTAGLAKLRDGKLTIFTTRDGLSNNSVISLHESSDGTLWIGTDGGGLDSLKHGIFRAYKVDDGLPDDTVGALCEDGQGVLWIGTHNGLGMMKGGAITKFSARQGLSNNNVISLCEDRDGNLWVGTDGGGLNRFKSGGFDVYKKANGLSSNSVASIFEDVEGDLWVGTLGGGLNRFREGKFTSYSTQSGLSDDEVRSILQDAHGNVWVATSHGLNRFKNGKLTIFTQRDGLASDSILSLFEGPEGSLWIGTRLGLNRLKNGVFTTYTTKDGLSDDTVLSITGDRSGSIWIGTTSGLNSLSNGKFKSYSTKDGLTDNSVWALHEDGTGALWIGTDGGGLNCWKNGRFTSLTTSEGLASNIVFALYEDSERALWIGTSGGLGRLKDGTLTSFTRRDGLFDNTVFQILEHRDDLWMSCNKGLFRVSKRELNRFADGEITHISSVSYGSSDGMKSHECNGGFQPAGCQTGDGRLWFPTTRGVAVIDPDHLALNTRPPKLAVEQVIVNGKQIDPHTSISFPPESEKFEFHFTALSFLDPAKVRFRYRLDGFDEAWTEGEDVRQASYTNLRPGDYTFRVMACNNDGVWNEEGTSFSFRLRPHFYQTLPFYGLLALAVGLIALSGYQMRVRQIHRRFSVVLAERGRLARDIHDTLAQGFVAIGLQLSAAADKLRESPESVEHHLELAQKLIRSSLAEARRSVWDLRPQALEGGDLAAALSDAAHQITRGSSIRLDFRVNGTPRVLPANVESNLLRIGQEALANSLKHADPESITLELTFDNQLVRIRVNDDGCGFDPDTAPNATTGHFGLLGISERVKQLRGRMTVRSKRGQGTEIAVEVPVQHNGRL